jgi:hypothetical protein
MKAEKSNKVKIDCPDCCTFTIVVSPQNCLTVKKKQADFLSLGKKISFENAINRIISEYRFAKDNSGTIIK